MKHVSVKEILIIKYFKELKSWNIILFYLFLLFVLIQLLLTAVKLEVTPFCLYGMYSEKLSVPASISQREIYLDEQPLSAFKISNKERDLLFTTLSNYLDIKNNSGVDIVQTRVESMKRIKPFTNSSFYRAISQKIYNHQNNLKEFEEWFKKKCRSLTDKNINTIKIIDRYYILNTETQSVKLSSIEQIAFF